MGKRNPQEARQCLRPSGRGLPDRRHDRRHAGRSHQSRPLRDHPVLSDAFITVIYAVMLGFLGFYALIDFLRASNLKKKKDFHGAARGPRSKGRGNRDGQPAQKIQAVKVPPWSSSIMTSPRWSKHFMDFPGAQRRPCGLAQASWEWEGLSDLPIFVYVLGVSSMTTVARTCFRLSSQRLCSRDAVCHLWFIFYTLAMGMLLGSCSASRSEPWSPRW